MVAAGGPQRRRGWLAEFVVAATCVILRSGVCTCWVSLGVDGFREHRGVSEPGGWVRRLPRRNASVVRAATMKNYPEAASCFFFGPDVV